MRDRPIAAGMLIAAVLIGSPFAVAATGDVLREGKRNGTATKETQIIGKITARQPTGGYVTRQSNLKTGSQAGGAAIYGCRSPAGGTGEGRAPCLRANNKSNGFAFEFATGEGGIGGFFSVGDPTIPNGGKPFTTNARGVASGLNADRVDGREGTDLLDKDSVLWALVNANIGGAAIVRDRGATTASRAGAGRYVVTFDRTISACAVQATLGDATGGTGSPGEISADQPAGAAVEINTYSSTGVAADPLATNGFYITVTC
ncbi:MAG: hypothetical protein ACRDLS_11750 [Solirubrobacteraceae bacterium]